MRISTLIKTALPAVLFTALLGCGSSGNGTMNVHLVDGPGDTYAKVSVTVKKLEIHGPGDQWQVLGDFSNAPKVIDDLQTLTGGVEELLVHGKSLPAGHYDQMRMLLVDASVTLQGTTTAIPLKVPSGMQTGIKFPVSFDVEPDTTRDVFIDFNANRSVFVHKAGMSGQYILRPVIHCVDKLVTGAIKGRLVDTSTPTAVGLAGVQVLAETLGSDGTGTIVRNTKTAADGTFTLDLLPKGGSYYVVAQPVVGDPLAGGKVYVTQVTGPISGITDTTPIVDGGIIAFAQETSFGSIQFAIGSTPGTDESYEVLISKTFAGGALDGKTFVIRTTDPYTENPAVGVPADTYAVALERTTTNTDGSLTIASTAAVAVTVLAGESATATLSF